MQMQFHLQHAPERLAVVQWRLATSRAPGEEAESTHQQRFRLVIEVIINQPKSFKQLLMGITI